MGEVSSKVNVLMRKHGTLQKVKLSWEPPRPLSKTKKPEHSEMLSNKVLETWTVTPIQPEEPDLNKEFNKEPMFSEKALRNNSTSWEKLVNCPELKDSKLQKPKKSSRKQLKNQKSTPLDGNETQG